MEGSVSKTYKFVFCREFVGEGPYKHINMGYKLVEVNKMSRTYKDSKIKKEINKALQEKKGGPHKQKRWVICSKCKGKGCKYCSTEGIVYE